MKYLLILILLSGCEDQSPSPAAKVELPSSPPVVQEKPAPLKADLETALWHLRYMRGLLEKKAPK